MPSTIRRRTPEELLQQVQAEEEYERRGRLKVFLGYASGVGKSFRMLDEGRRRHERGQDVVVGAIQPKTSHEIECVLVKLEVIPPAGLGARQPLAGCQRAFGRRYLRHQLRQYPIHR